MTISEQQYKLYKFRTGFVTQSDVFYSYPTHMTLYDLKWPLNDLWTYYVSFFVTYWYLMHYTVEYALIHYVSDDLQIKFSYVSMLLASSRSRGAGLEVDSLWCVNIF